ncbi:MAG: UDP-3-O-acyl-N-acetylglucosamine deacetylase [Planctomycetaceae bacterium]
MPSRKQRTLARPVQLAGRGLFGCRPVNIGFHPAPANHGIVFRRVDLPGQPAVKADIECVRPEPRRTVLQAGEARVEMTEHVLAALTGLRIDNCLVTLDAVETPTATAPLKSSSPSCWTAESRSSPPSVPCMHLTAADDRAVRHCGPHRTRPIQHRRTADRSHHRLPGHANRATDVRAAVCPNRFVTDIAFARTFVLEAEVDALRAQGFGLRTTTRDLLVFGDNGPIDNDLYTLDECARHKLLDCIGDFALLGADLIGEIRAFRPGHQLNQEVARVLRANASEQAPLRTAG